MDGRDEPHEYLKRGYEVIAALGQPVTGSWLRSKGLTRTTLSQLVALGMVERPVRGVYHVPDPMHDDPRVLWAAMSLAMDVTFCLLSAASYHGLTEESAGIPCAAIRKAARMPDESTVRDVRVDYRRWSDAEMEQGVDLATISGCGVAVTNPSRTVVDMFRYSDFAVGARVDPEIEGRVFQDCLSRYLDRFPDDAASGSLRDHAERFGLWGQLKPLVQVNVIRNERTF
jgi:predicted transcriptional regulator of viral defense system